MLSRWAQYYHKGPNKREVRVRERNVRMEAGVGMIQCDELRNSGASRSWIRQGTRFSPRDSRQT